MWPDSSAIRVLALSVRGPRFESLLGHVMLKSKKITVFTSPAMSPTQYTCGPWLQIMMMVPNVIFHEGDPAPP